MNELQDMLRVQARLHRKQGAIALGDLFDNAGQEIEQLREQLAKANERVEMCEKIFSEAPDLTFEDVKTTFNSELNKFAIEKKLEVLNEFKKECGIILPAHKLQDKIEQLRKEQEK